MADSTFRTVSPLLKAVDLGDGTYAMAVYLQGQRLDGTVGASAWVVPFDAPAEIVDFVTLLQAGGYPVCISPNAEAERTINPFLAGLDAGVGRCKVVFCDGTIPVTGAIEPESDMEIELQGKIFISDAVQSDLASNAASGQPDVILNSVAGLHAGQRVTVTDAAKTNLYGQTWGDCALIASITGNTVTLDTNLSYNYTTANGAFLAVTASAIVADQKHNVYLRGGEIDGNKANQSTAYPVWLNHTEEEMRAACGVSIYNSDDVVVDGTYIHDCNLHNIASLGLTGDPNLRTKIIKPRTEDAFQKNIYFAYCEHFSIDNPYIDGAAFEDGISLYGDVKHGHIDTPIIKNIPRNSILVESNDTDIDIISPQIEGDGVNSYRGIEVGEMGTCDHIRVWGGSIVGVLNAVPITKASCCEFHGVDIHDVRGYGYVFSANANDDNKIFGGKVYRFGTDPGNYAAVEFNSPGKNNVVDGLDVDGNGVAARGIWEVSSDETTTNEVRGCRIRGCTNPMNLDFATGPYTSRNIVLSKVAAPANNIIRSAEDLSQAVTIEFTITNQPDVARCLSFTLTHANITAFTLQLIGTDGVGRDFIDTFTEADGWSFNSLRPYAHIAHIRMTSRTGTGVGDTCSVGTTYVVAFDIPVYQTSDVFKIQKDGADCTIAAVDVNTTYYTYNLDTIGITGGETFVFSVRDRSSNTVLP